MNVTELTKQDIIDFFDNQNCSDCLFKEECQRNEDEYDAISICELFELI